METILLVILVIVTVTMIGAVLLQRSEGGALGIGGGGGPGAMFSARGSANFLTRMTAVLAAVFMILAMVLALLNKGSDEGSSGMDVATPPVQEDQDRLRSFESEDYEPVPLEELIEDSVPPVSESDGQSGNSDGPAVPAPD